MTKGEKKEQSSLPPPVRAVACGAQWEPSRTAALSLSELQDVLWRNARHAHVWVEDPGGGGGASLVGRDATRHIPI
jgi:hypothetical protein